MTSSMNNSLVHPFDLESGQSDSLDLFAEELPEQRQLMAPANWSDCASSASSFSCGGGCIACIFCVGSIVSCG